MLLVIYNWKSWNPCEYTAIYLLQLPVGIPACSVISSLGLGVPAALAEEPGTEQGASTAMRAEG